MNQLTRTSGDSSVIISVPGSSMTPSSSSSPSSTVPSSLTAEGVVIPTATAAKDLESDIWAISINGLG